MGPRRGGVGGRAMRHRGDHLAACLEPAYGPGDLDLADRGFPSRQAIAAKIEAGKHFAWRVSAAWNLRRPGRPLPDGTWKAKITWRGRTYKVRVIEYHIDQVFDLPPGHPLTAAPPAGPSVRVLDDGGGQDGEGDAGLCRRPDGTIRVEVSETVTIITSLMDTAAYPARDIADLYGMRWASELVYLEEKQTLAGGQPITAATPAGAYRTAIATVAAHQALRIAGASIAAAAGAEPARISATALRDAVTASIGAGQGATTPALAAAIEIFRRCRSLTIPVDDKSAIADQAARQRSPEDKTARSRLKHGGYLTAATPVDK